MTIPEYIDKLNSRYKTGISTEHSYRGELQNLVESLAPEVIVTNEPTRVACGASDYIIIKGKIPIWYIEAEGTGKSFGSMDILLFNESMSILIQELRDISSEITF